MVEEPETTAPIVEETEPPSQPTVETEETLETTESLQDEWVEEAA